MKNKKKPSVKLPEEAPPNQLPPELNPSTVPEKPVKEPEVSPYDFPPPGDGFFPQLF